MKINTILGCEIQKSNRMCFENSYFSLKSEYKLILQLRQRHIENQIIFRTLIFQYHYASKFCSLQNNYIVELRLFNL